MTRQLLSYGLIALLASPAMAQRAAPTPAARLNALVWSGQLDSAAHLARRLGSACQVSLADIELMRGRATLADSLYRHAVAHALPRSRAAEASLAELAARRGDADVADSTARSLAMRYQVDGVAWPVDDVIAAGRAYVVMGSRDPQAFHDALRTFDHAVEVDSNNVDARLRAADILLDKYNAPDAVATWQDVLKRVPNEPRALLGLARAAAFEGNGSATVRARASLWADSMLVPGYVLLAQQHLGAEAFDSARSAASRALSIDSTAVDAWAVLGAIAWQQGDSSGLAAARAAARRAEPRSARFDADLADAAEHQRRYAEAAVLARQAVSVDSESARAWGVLGENQLRTGAIDQGRASLEHAFALDPYNLWHKNTLDLLDNLRTFTTVSTARFQLVAPADEAGYLALYLGPLLEAAYDTFAVRYGYRPPTPIRVELYGRHADFSVRTVGLTGLGALGVSFGTVLVLDSPRAQPVGELNYGSTSWHELAHTFTLGLSKHRVPRWISEGLSLREEQRAGHGWGAQVSPDFLAAYRGGVLPAASSINEGLMRPTFPAEIGFSYYEASLVLAMIEAEHGIAAIRAMLTAYGDGLDTPGVLQRVFATTPAEFDRHFDAWLRARFAAPLAAIDSSDGQRPTTGPYVDLMHAGAALIAAGHPDSARVLLLRAQAIFPDDGTVDGPAWQLAHIDRARGDVPAAIAQVSTVTMHSETAEDANAVEAALRLQIADTVGALAALERQQWIAPYDPALHLRIATLAEAIGDWPRAVRERRAVLALAPPDSLEARYQFARTLLHSGERDAARREILRVLEQAPAFEKAQALLLELQGAHT